MLEFHIWLLIRSRILRLPRCDCAHVVAIARRTVREIHCNTSVTWVLGMRLSSQSFALCSLRSRSGRTTWMHGKTSCKAPVCHDETGTERESDNGGVQSIRLMSECGTALCYMVERPDNEAPKLSAPPPSSQPISSGQSHKALFPDCITIPSHLKSCCRRSLRTSC